MNNKPLGHAAVNSFLISQLLFFIDEGYYDFRWMTNIGNWLVFIFYLVVLTGILYLINLGLQKMNISNYVMLGINIFVFPIILLMMFNYL
ncbi:hypothetical protein FLJC2902T_21420 [Flavobacterium limnosediminis JC2902]|uniref:Uncharacterized protein n=1 Tax=Flavobacterium limnosediminis JC2902 TaxID=1341181 RepID=V6SRY7_9FLAO|nr:hypothetical protein [Flavobacterium limnosediminis]ESU27170.1 hypothetical protein FLJC2902T_21420 [Flavobacterium limnosediminis JC2902]